MSISESEIPNELLRSIATSLKSIQSSLDQLTGAVEGVAESIEKAHEPEGDLGVHLVGALKELTSVLHKRTQQERSPQPQQRAQPPSQNRREDRHQSRPDQRTQQDLHPQELSHGVESSESEIIHVEPQENAPSTPPLVVSSSIEGNSPSRLHQVGVQSRKPRPNRSRNRGRGDTSPSPLPKE